MASKKRKPFDAQQIGELADRADNFYHAGLLPMPAEFTANQLREAMLELRNELRRLHVAATGENPWEGEP